MLEQLSPESRAMWREIDIAVDDDRMQAAEKRLKRGEQAGQLAPIEFARHVFRDVDEIRDMLICRRSVGPVLEQHAGRTGGVGFVGDVEAGEHEIKPSLSPTASRAALRKLAATCRVPGRRG